MENTRRDKIVKTVLKNVLVPVVTLIVGVFATRTYYIQVEVKQTSDKEGNVQLEELQGQYDNLKENYNKLKIDYEALQVKYDNDINGGSESNLETSSLQSAEQTPAQTSNGTSVWLDSLEPIVFDGLEGEWTNRNNNIGEEATHILASITPDGYAEYYLKSKRYKSLTGKFFIPEEAKNTNRTGHFTILCDGEEVYTSPGITAGDLPIPFDIDITGCERLRIVIDYEKTFMLSEVKLHE